MRLSPKAISLALTLLAANALAYQGGITGRSGKQTLTCSNCHAPTGAATTLNVTGPLTVTAGTRGTYTIELSGGAGAFGGANVATDIGTLANRDGTLRVTNSELTHSDRRAFSGGMVSWGFYWTAPATPGPAKIWVAAQSVDGNGAVTGDREAMRLLNITVTPANQPPTLVTAATATPAAVTGTTVTLNVAGNDDSGAANLLYTWTATGPAAVTYSQAMGTNAAKTVTATFTRSGAYTFTARIADAAGLFIISTVNVNVAATYTTLRVTPATRTLSLGSQLGLSAAAFDQFGQPMTLPGAVAWSVPAGQGTITAAGLYTTPATVGGPFTVTATCAAKTGTAALTVVSGAPPVIATAAASAPLTNASLKLTVLGSDDGGEGLLRYTWTATGPAAVTFTPNATNAAKSTVATLTRAGTYVFTATLTDRAGLTATSTVTVTVAPELTGLRVLPATVTVKPLATQLLTATSVDQFGRPMTAPGTVAWVSFGGGSVSSTGEFTAGSTLGGPFQVRATLVGKTATSDVTIANGGTPVVIGTPSATPAAVLGRTTRVRVNAADDLGEAALTYRWDSTGPAPVAFAPNGTNSAQQATATFEQAGSYLLTVTIANAAGKTTSADVTVDVLASPDKLEVTPDAVTLRANAMQAFTAAVVDQFGDTLPLSGELTWSTVAAGRIDDSGMLRAVGTSGRYAVSANAMGLRGQAQVTIDAKAPVVALQSPIEAAQLEGEATLAAAASDDDVLVEVRFYAGDTLLGSATAPPWELKWDTTQAMDAFHEVYAVAEDAAGNTTQSDSARVRVWNDKSKPPPGEMVQGQGCSAAPTTLGPLVMLLAVLVVARRLRRASRARATARRVAESSARGEAGREARPLDARHEAVTTVPSARHLEGDTRSSRSFNPAPSRAPKHGTPGATRPDRRLLPMFRTTLAAAVLMLSAAAQAQALTPEQRERCATRLSVNVLGQSPSAALLAAADPRTQVPTLLGDTVFINRFAAFIQARFSPEPNRFAAQDTPYYLTQKILTEGKPWRDLFVGPYVFTRQAADQNGTLAPVITEDPAGFGYTQSPDWRRRYQGNELAGYRLVHAYRLINNALGMELKAALNTDGISADGRKASSCSGCHYHPIFGLDLIARVLPLRNRTVAADVPQTLLGGKVITTEKELLQALVDSPDFSFNVCRTAMQYAYGRAEYKCEGPVFDACMTAFSATPTMQAALSAVLRHPTYCQ